MNRSLFEQPVADYAAIVASLTLEDLPPADTTRWVSRRKAQVVAAVRAGLLTMDDARERYALSDEEFFTWQAAVDRFGVAGLRVKRAAALRGRAKAEASRPAPS